MILVVQFYNYFGIKNFFFFLKGGISQGDEMILLSSSGEADNTEGCLIIFCYFHFQLGARFALIVL